MLRFLAKTSNEAIWLKSQALELNKN